MVSAGMEQGELLRGMQTEMGKISSLISVAKTKEDSRNKLALGNVKRNVKFCIEEK